MLLLLLHDVVPGGLAVFRRSLREDVSHVLLLLLLLVVALVEVVELLLLLRWWRRQVRVVVGVVMVVVAVADAIAVGVVPGLRALEANSFL